MTSIPCAIREPTGLVHGHELQALEGAAELLRAGRIRAIQFEFGGANVDSRTFFRDFWNLLYGRFGYSLYQILPGCVPSPSGGAVRTIRLAELSRMCYRRGPSFVATSPQRPCAHSARA
jgi:hypothetical protein